MTPEWISFISKRLTHPSSSYLKLLRQNYLLLNESFGIKLFAVRCEIKINQLMHNLHTNDHLLRRLRRTQMEKCGR